MVAITARVASDHPSSPIAPLLDALDNEQRAAALLPGGPALVIAPAGSGKTTTLIARLGVLLVRSVPADRIAVVTFNREAAAELSQRIAARLAPLVPGAERIEVRTLHALARQILLDAHGSVRLLPDRLPLLRAARRRAAARSTVGDAPPPEPAELDGQLSAWKVEGRPPPPAALPSLQAYESLKTARGVLDFDDLVVGAVTALERDTGLRIRWQARFTHLAVDEFQDVDAAQFRLVRLLATPQDNLFVVGDDDQTIYAWRLADVRRILTFERYYPAARRVQLATNYRCPPAVVAASRRLVAVNAERFIKRIEPAPANRDAGAISVMATADPQWPDRVAALAVAEAARVGRCCVLARTRAELGPILMAMLRAGFPHATAIDAPLQAEPVTRLLDDARRLPFGAAPFQELRRLRAGLGWSRGDGNDTLGDEDHAALDALLGWAAAFRALGTFLAAADTARTRLAALRDPAAPIELVTVHGAKGREWPSVVIVGFEAERFPNRRSLAGAADPVRALEEERRLAYVAVTRAAARLILAFDPSRPSPFLAEMGYSPTAGATSAR